MWICRLLMVSDTLHCSWNWFSGFARSPGIPLWGGGMLRVIVPAIPYYNMLKMAALVYCFHPYTRVRTKKHVWTLSSIFGGM